MQGKIESIDEVELKNNKIILRVDFNVSLNKDHTIANDARIKQSLPTINYLLKNRNKLIIVSHLGRPKEKDSTYSLKNVAQDLQNYLPDYKVILVDDFLLEVNKTTFDQQKDNEIILLENIRFFSEEEANEDTFAQKLSKLADIYVNDAFAVSNRSHASIVAVPKYLPHYGGLLLKKEIQMISRTIHQPKKPFLAIIGGAKIKTKMDLLNKLTEITDDLIVGGGLANTFLLAQGFDVGQSLCDKDNLDQVRRLFFLAAEKHTTIHLPVDAIVGFPNKNEAQTVSIEQIPQNMQILDIGPQSQAKFAALIGKAQTIIWNGPVGYFENPAFKGGTDFIYYSITQNQTATSIVGGGDTIAAISKKEYLDKITHISTGGGAMLEFIEKGTLPGIEALKK